MSKRKNIDDFADETDDFVLTQFDSEGPLQALKKVQKTKQYVNGGPDSVRRNLFEDFDKCEEPKQVVDDDISEQDQIINRRMSSAKSDVSVRGDDEENAKNELEPPFQYFYEAHPHADRDHAIKKHINYMIGIPSQIVQVPWDLLFPDHTAPISSYIKLLKQKKEGLAWEYIHCINVKIEQITEKDENGKIIDELEFYIVEYEYKMKNQHDVIVESVRYDEYQMTKIRLFDFFGLLFPKTPSYIETRSLINFGVNCPSMEINNFDREINKHPPAHLEHENWLYKHGLKSKNYTKRNINPYMWKHMDDMVPTQNKSFYLVEGDFFMKQNAGFKFYGINIGPNAHRCIKMYGKKKALPPPNPVVCDLTIKKTSELKGEAIDKVMAEGIKSLTMITNFACSVVKHKNEQYYLNLRGYAFGKYDLRYLENSTLKSLE